MKKILTVAVAALLLLLAGCHKRVTVAPPKMDSFSQMLHDKENMEFGCEMLTHDPEIDAPNCALMYSLFTEYRDRYAKQVDPAALNIKMGDVLWYGVKPEADTLNGIPRMIMGNGLSAQAYFAEYIAPIIVWANPYATGCEALHFFHYKLHNKDLRTLPLDGDEEHLYVYMIIGHGMKDDPMHYECWREAEDRTPVPPPTF